VVAIASPPDATSGAMAPPTAAIVAERVAALAAEEGPAWLLVGATPDGRDTAGTLAVLLDLAVGWNADAITWADAGPVIESAAIGGRVVNTVGFVDERGIVIVRPGTCPASEAAVPGSVVTAAPAGVEDLPATRLVETLPAAATAASIEEARVVVVGGRGVGGPDGFGVLGEIAAEVGGAVGATRAAVDSGWVPFTIQVGQTGRTIRPAAYLGFGVSGAIQHTVGMRTAGTIVVVNRDPDAPFAELADLFVVGDLGAVAPALRDALRMRRGAS
jgi:electron transfer flavoprotein alpha subunit